MKNSKNSIINLVFLALEQTKETLGSIPSLKSRLKKAQDLETQIKDVNKQYSVEKKDIQRKNEVSQKCREIKINKNTYVD